MAMIRRNLSILSDEISLICQKLGRNPKDITLVGITKYASAPMLEEALACGLLHIGENKVQQAKEKYASLAKTYPGVKKHMVGHLQTNKVKDALEIFDIIQSVDSLKLAQAISRRAEKMAKRAKIFIQVNTAKEPQKYGVFEEDALKLIEEAAHLKNLYITGLMAVAPLTDEKDIIRDAFRRLRGLKEKAALAFAGHSNIDMRFLSMGMSSDYRIALEEGSNMVRIGSAIFKP